jgi:Glycosyl hydrolase family 26
VNLGLSSIRTGALACAASVLFALLGASQASAQGHVALGVAINPPLNAALTHQYIQAAGAPPAVEMWFRDFDAPLFYSTELAQVHSIGATPMVTWDPMSNGVVVPYANIVDGQFDSYFKAQADYVASTHTAVDIRLMHEMNVPPPGSAWGPGSSAGTPAQFIQAWRHIVTIFRQQGATNVRWVWAPNTDCNGRCPFTAYYPGDAWVDDVGLDGYNFAGIHDVAWMSLQQVFQSSYKTLTRMTDKPVMFTETASSSDGGNKAQWIKQGFLDTIPKLFPRVVEVTWWERIDQTDWQINSSPSAEAAWREVVADPYYGGAGGVSTSAPAKCTPPNRATTKARHAAKNRRKAKARSRAHSQSCKTKAHGTQISRKRQQTKRASSGPVRADIKATRTRRQLGPWYGVPPVSPPASRIGDRPVQHSSELEPGEL